MIPFNEYNKNQLICTSDRVILNSKEDNVFLIAGKDLVFSANGDLHINTNGKSVINSSKIQLGLGNDVQPIAKADNLVSTLDALLSSLQALSQSLSSAVATGVGVSSLLSINQAGTKLATDVKGIKSKLEAIKSKTSFTN